MSKTIFLTSMMMIVTALISSAVTGVYGQGQGQGQGQSQNEMQQIQQQQQQQQLQQQQQQQQAQQLQQQQSGIGQGSTQPNRVGIHDNAQQSSGEGANSGGTVTDPTLAANFPGGIVSANCFGKVIQDRAQEHLDDPDEGTLGDHVSDPVPEIPGREVPRQGIGNQDQGHPAAHGAFNSQFDADDLENAQASC